MMNFTLTIGQILRILSFCFLFLLYLLIGEVWFISLYTHDNWVNISDVIVVAILLILFYTFINTRLSLGREREIFFIPILPSFIGAVLFHPIENWLFPNLITQDDFGSGILMVMIAIPHWVAIMLSFWLAHTIKTRRKEG